MSRQSFEEKATSSSNLVNRALGNAQFGSNNFENWVKDIINEIEYSKVLDVCCGTGNQLVLYATNKSISTLCGVDMSLESLSIAQSRLRDLNYSKELHLKHASMDDIFNYQDYKNIKFDLVSCFYGLYYSKDVKELLVNMKEHLNKKGTVLIVGPYGKNNRLLFELLEKRYKLDSHILYTCSDFMEDSVLPILSKDMNVRTKIFVNEVKYPNAQELLKYWRSSTFYSPEHETYIKKDIEQYFTNNSEFIITKHVMACVASAN